MSITIRTGFILFFVLLLNGFNMKAQLVNWEWVVNAEGSQGDWGNYISLDDENSILITGRYNGVVSFGSLTLPNSGFNTAVFTTKLDSAGNFLWAKNCSTSGGCFFYSNVADNNLNIYSVGEFMGSLFIDTVEVISSGGSDPIIVKYDRYGNLLWVEQIFGSGQGFAISSDVDEKGYIYVTGGFEDSLYLGNLNLVSSGNNDAFMAKFDSLGNCIWLTNLCSGVLYDRIYLNKTDNLGNNYVTGSFNGSASFGDTILTSSGNADGFILKTDSSGTVLWSHQFGGTSSDQGYSVYYDNIGNCYLKGFFNGTATFGDTSITAQNGMNFFIAKLDSNGDFIWVRSMLIECSLLDDYYFNSITCDNDGNLYMTAWFANTFQFDGISLTSAGNYDSFIMKLSPEGEALWAMQMQSSGYIHSRSITIDNSGSLYITGWFNDSALFGDISISPYGGADVFIAKLHEEPVSVSYNEITETLEISVYPNPAKDYVNITNMEQQIEKAEIIDLNGKIVRTFSSSLSWLDVSGLRDGTYLLKLYEQNIIFVTKIIIQ